MFFTSLRRQRLCARAFALLLSVAVCGGTLNWGHAGGDDPECEPQLVQHDHTAHRFTAETQQTGSQDEHCNLCHLLRLLQSALPSGSLLNNRVSPLDTRRIADSDLVTPIVSVTIQSRAPPAASL
ncbi:MAG TPA: hypothetical protein VFA59_09980 [Vicinamibacterales bacterium]|nr:hypothetical protein [Vicinamibacterales bacterium]